MNSDEYLARITSAHISRPRFMAWLKALLDMLCEYGTAVEQMNALFSLDQAVGQQLDFVGEMVGASRALPFTSVLFESGMMNDRDYRAFIRAKILQNMWDGTNETLPGLWSAVYTDLQLSYVDNQDMTMTITVTGDISETLSELIQAGMIVPCPSGVQQIYNINTTTIEPAEIGVGTGLYEFGNDDFPNQAE